MGAHGLFNRSLHEGTFRQCATQVHVLRNRLFDSLLRLAIGAASVHLLTSILSGGLAISARLLPLFGFKVPPLALHGQGRRLVISGRQSLFLAFKRFFLSLFVPELHNYIPVVLVLAHAHIFGISLHGPQNLGLQHMHLVSVQLSFITARLSIGFEVALPACARPLIATGARLVLVF